MRPAAAEESTTFAEESGTSRVSHQRWALDFLTALLLASASLTLYSHQLGVSPIYLAPDEVTIALNAHSLATTGEDFAGRPYPLYIQITAGSWFHPFVVYLLALEFKFAPLNEFTIRLPTACVGVLDVVLMYFVAYALFKRRAWAVLAAVLLMLTPAHFLHSRFALEYIYPLPFVLTWLLGLFTYLDTDDQRALFAGTLVLGLGFFSYIASIFVMPLYALLTCGVLLLYNKPARAYAFALGGFFVPIVFIFVPWLLRHPSAYGDTIRQYSLYDSRHLNPFQGIREFFSWPNVAERTSLYWRYLDPSFLFLDASAPFMFSTRTTGVFLVPLAPLLAVGLRQVMVSADAKHAILLTGLLTGPLPAVLVKEPGSINRALELLPFVALLAVLGGIHLWSAAQFRPWRLFCLGAAVIGGATGVGYAAWTSATQRRISGSTTAFLLTSALAALIGAVSERTALRIALVALLAIVPVQFEYFYRDYFTDYRPRSSEAFHGNTRDAMEYIIERDRRENLPSIFLSGDIDGIRRYWRLYLIKHGREDLLTRTVVFGSARHLEDQTIPPRSLVMARIGEPATERLLRGGTLTLMTTVTEPGGRPAFAVYQR
jgi:4-amino-4-deoxy-L-arabinose transferase-like glycosyltransferase